MPRITDQENPSPTKGKLKACAMQTEPQEDTKGTQFPEAMTVEEADKLWFQDKTIAAQRKVYSLDQIWRFLSVQIS